MRRSVFVLFAVLVFLASPALALANGDHIHIGGLSTGIPPFVAWIAGGVFGFFIAMFVLQWIRFNLARRQGTSLARKREASSHRKEESDG